MADSMPEMVWTAQPDGSLDFCNRRWLEFTGLTFSETMGFGWLRGIHADDRATAEDAWALSLALGRAFEAEFRMQNAGGAYRFMLTRAVPFRNEVGAIVRWIGIMTDIESQKRAEASARESAAAFRAFAEAISEIAWIGAPDGTIEWFNHRWYAYTGVSRDTSLGQGWQDALDTHNLSAVLQKWASAIATGEPYEAEVLIRGRDGQARWFIARAHPLRDTAGRIVRWYGTTADIDLQKRAERDLAFLAETGMILGAAADVSLVLQRLADASVPTFCDICSISLLDPDGVTLRRSAVAFAGIDSKGSTDSLEEKLAGAPAPNQPNSPALRALAGESTFEPQVSAAWLDSISNDPQHARLIERLGIVSLITVPLGRIGYRQGALTFCTTRRSSRKFGGTDLALAEEVGRRAGMALANAESFERERRIAMTLQGALLPRTFPELPGVRFDATYVPASREAEVGGDWYDAFPLPGGRIGLSIGDVAGHGLTAAAAMGKLRQAMQSAAFIRPDPSAMLEAADLTLRGIEPICLASAFAAIFDLESGVLRYASAGHPPQFLRLPDASLEEMGPTAPMLGICAPGSNPARAVAVARGSLLVLYTDGLTEATRDIVHGEALLKSFLTGAAVVTAERPAQALHHALLTAGSSDDVAILTMHLDALDPTAASLPRPALTANGATVTH
jgi:PAS domain S-box-containing protein